MRRDAGPASPTLPRAEKLELRRLLSGDFHPDFHEVEGFVTQTNLVSNQANVAAHQDTNLQNAWGVSFAPGGPMWVSDNASGVATLYDGNGVPQPQPTPQKPNQVPLVVTIPGGGGASPANPTGQVFAGGKAFPIHETDAGGVTHAGNSIFVFVGEDGGISGWNPNVDPTHAVLAIDNSSNPTAANGAVYKGAALAQDSKGNTDLFVTNFRSGHVEVYGGDFSAVTTKGNFSDPRIPDGFAPFNIANVGGNLVVTFAKQNAEKHDDVAGDGNGFVDVFNTDGVLLRRFQHGRFLNSPWGIATVPSQGWGELAGDMLVGQFGDGRIDVFSPRGRFLGFLRDKQGAPVTIDGLWSLTPGSGSATASTDTIYFTAGPDGETNGLFGSLAFTPREQRRHHHDGDGRD